ncbi:hypothetical protein GE061_002214 [Apolygus lucorum]|uniref:Superoxide dismutase [Cu-Zn] n=1 Tax=Apolygus lucorum TaxID=248454 RepID=A0A8S9X5Y4_APOLU|nr:hypothetical protein GE061_002214 [Apolygus lucorum]
MVRLPLAGGTGIRSRVAGGSRFSESSPSAATGPSLSLRSSARPNEPRRARSRTPPRAQTNIKMRSIAAILAFMCVAANAQQKAIVVFTTGGNGVVGNVTFTQEGGSVRLEGTVENLKPGEHGFHIHEKGDLTSGCTSTGGHYNPYSKNHGGPHDKERHVGDLGNIVSEPEGVAHVAIVDKVISLVGPTSILGRAVVIHSDRDDLGKGGFDDSLKTGHAGTRVACGIIGTLNPGTQSLAASSASANVGYLTLISLVSLRFFQS